MSNVVGRWIVAGAIRSLMNPRSLQLECATVLHEALFVPVLFYISKTMVCREKDRPKMDNLRFDGHYKNG